MTKGKVYLVGAGPGNPELITVRGHSVLSKAEVVIYDSLANERLLDLAQKAKKIYVGKRRGEHSIVQEEINRIIVSEALKGKRVVRLKGGDPFVFGRGGEELTELTSHQIPFEVVPGVTAGVAVPAYMGIPVTHRGVSRSITFVTGHTKEETLNNINWEALAQLGGTIAFYMGLNNISEIIKNLLSNGIDINTPIAVICNGTLPNQEMVKGTLADIEAKLKEKKLVSPALIILGEVVSISDDFSWYHPKPLYKKKVVVTRASNQSSKLQELLEAEGASTVLLPTIDISPKENLSLLREKITDIEHYDWLFFTSVNAIRIFFDELTKMNKDIRSLAKCKIACIGTVSRKELQARGIIADLIPKNQSSEGFVREFLAMLNENEKAQNILLPTSAIAKDTIETALAKASHTVCSIPVYDNLPIDYDADYLETLFCESVDWVSFCSSSAVTNFIKLIKHYNIETYFKETLYAAIGDITAKKLEEYGLKATVIPSKPTIEAMTEEIVKYYKD